MLYDQKKEKRKKVKRKEYKKTPTHVSQEIKKINTEGKDIEKINSFIYSSRKNKRK